MDKIAFDEPIIKIIEEERVSFIAAEVAARLKGQRVLPPCGYQWAYLHYTNGRPETGKWIPFRMLKEMSYDTMEIAFTTKHQHNDAAQFFHEKASGEVDDRYGGGAVYFKQPKLITCFRVSRCRNRGDDMVIYFRNWPKGFQA